MDKVGKKVWVALGAVVAVLGVVLGGAALGLSEQEKQQAIEVIKWLAVMVIGGHAATDIAFSRVAPEEDMIEVDEDNASEEDPSD